MHQNLFCGLSPHFFLYTISVQQWPWNSKFNRILQWLLDITVYFYLVGDLRIASFVHLKSLVPLTKTRFPPSKNDWVWLLLSKLLEYQTMKYSLSSGIFVFWVTAVGPKKIMDFARTTSSFENPKAIRVFLLLLFTDSIF